MYSRSQKFHKLSYFLKPYVPGVNYLNPERKLIKPFNLQPCERLKECIDNNTHVILSINSNEKIHVKEMVTF